MNDTNPLRPWGGFDPSLPGEYGRAVDSLWDLMRDGKVHDKLEVIDALRAKHPTLRRVTIIELIRKACRHGDLWKPTRSALQLTKRILDSLDQWPA